MASNENNSRSNIPENSSSKPMDSKRDVEVSPDEKTDQDFPGYPHYPANEDIMDQRTGSHRVDADLENIGAGPNASGVNQRFVSGQDNERSQAADLQDDADNRNEEIGLPQNVSNEELGEDQSGTDVEEAAEKGSTNP